MLRVGIVGLPNVGKSSLFNALTAAGAPAENYPFCTVEPNVGTVEVPDSRLARIQELVDVPEKVPTFIHFVDIAGLVSGASRGEGLGNRFLAHIRDVDAVAHVLRCFEDPDVSHVIGDVDPVRDLEIVETELALADLETVERRLETVERKARSGERDAQREESALQKVHAALEQGRPVRRVELSATESPEIEDLHLLTAKPVLHVANVGEGEFGRRENEHVARLRNAVDDAGEKVVVISAALEAELAELEPDSRAEFLRDLGLEESGLERLIRAAYRLLGLITFFTHNEKETRAWTVPRGASAPEAAGRIHSDFEAGFIRAETIGFETFDRVGSIKEAREEGLVRSEGRDYRVRDGDIILFRHGA